MSRMKRALKVLAAVLLVLVIAAVSVWYSAFGHNSPIVDGQVLAPGVETVKDGFVSAFLLDAGPGKVALVDAGKDAGAVSILSALSRRGLSKSAVAAIFLTHGHGDHTAGCRVFPDAQVYALEAELPTVGDAAKIGHPLHDGEAVDVGDLHVEAFATPGHTPGSAVYLARGVLFFGDSAGASKDGAVMRAVRLFSKDPAQNVASLKALELRLRPRAQEIQELAFAHTGPLAGFAPLAAFAANQ
jgi:glyoxylase-like metal-dependent hydrolase (beta-lactamase superfamily II)